MPSTPTVQPLTFRLEKGTPLTAEVGDENLRILRDAQNAALALMGVALNPDGTLKSPPIVFGNSTTGTDAYLITPTPAVESTASLIGRLIVMIPNFTNAGAATLEIAGLTAQAIKKFYNQPLETGDIKAGQSVVLSWDGANYQMQSWPGVVQPSNYAQDVGSANAPAVVYAVGGATSVPAALYTGYRISVKMAAANTGASTLTIGAVTAPIKKNVSSALQSGDLVVGQVAEFIYDGTNFQLLSTTPSGAAALPAQAYPAGTATLTFTHSYGFKPSSVRVVLLCNVDDIGFLAGEEVEWYNLIGTAGPGSDQFKPPVITNTSTVRVSLLPAFTPNLNRADTGAMAGILRTSWSIKVYVSP